MFDDLQDMGDSAAFLDELEEADAEPPLEQPTSRGRRRSASTQRVLGMTPVQLFIISIELFMMVCILGFFAMLVTGKMVPSFL